MDSFLKNAVSNLSQSDNHHENKESNQDNGGNGNGNPLMGFVNNALGGGQKAETKEDFIDKVVDFAQEKLLHEGAQNDENAMEQAKDEMIGNAVRQGLQQVTGKDFTKH